MDIIKIFAFALITLTVYVLLKQYKPELAMAVLISGSGIILLYILSGIITELFSLRSLITELGIKSSYFLIAFKALGIVCITSFCADICKDSGSCALESKVSFAGKCAVFITVFPLIKAIVESVSALL